MKIQILLTGGTIGSEKNKNGSLDTNSLKTGNLLIDEYQRKKHRDETNHDDFVDFLIDQPIDTLSENMTLELLSGLIKGLDSALKRCYSDNIEGIIITHGTDTLAFTANLLSLLFYNTKIPIILVSSAKPLAVKDANGYANFNKGIDLIKSSIKPGIYVPYENRDGEMIVHNASHLKQSRSFSADFESAHERLNNTRTIIDGLQESILRFFQGELLLDSNILVIDPYPGISYDNYSLHGVDAVLHRTYHSYTMPTQGDGKHSVLSLAHRCEDQGIPIYFAPISSRFSHEYISTLEIKKRGLIPLFDMTYEMAYAYLLIKYS